MPSKRNHPKPEYFKSIPEGEDPSLFYPIRMPKPGGESVIVSYLRAPSKIARRFSLADLRADVWDKTNGHCFYCKAELHPFKDFHIDHVVPRSKGGLDIIENLVPACRTCNLSKGAKSLANWKGHHS